LFLLASLGMRGETRHASSLCGASGRGVAGRVEGTAVRVARGRLLGGDFAGFGIDGRGFIISGLGRTPPPCLRLLDPVALAVQLQNMDMVGEAIEQRAAAGINFELRPYRSSGPI
jgi:hypothetical protein